MKNMFQRLIMGLVVAGTVAVRAESVNVVEVYDLQRKVTREIMATAEMRELKKTIEAEARVYPKALELTKKEWDAAEKPAPAAPGAKAEKGVAPTPFPASMLSPRKFVDKGSFTDKDKAQKKLDQLEKVDADLFEKEAKEKKAKQQLEASNPASKKKSAGMDDHGAAAGRAATALQAKIDELVKSQPSGSTNAAAAAAN